MGGDGCRSGLLDQLGSPFELGARLVVGASGGMLPGEHLDRGRDVGDEAELGAELDGLPGIGEGAGMIAEHLGPSVGEHGQHGHQHGQRAAVSGVGEAAFEELHPVRAEAEEAGGERRGKEVARIVCEVGFGPVQLERSGQQTPTELMVPVDDRREAAMKIAEQS